MLIVVIGGGPGGYVAAIRSAQLGAEVHLAECEKLGGTCLNAGCIPTKALLRVSEFYDKTIKNAVTGVVARDVGLDWAAALAGKQKTVDKLADGVLALLRGNGVVIHNGRASMTEARKVRINGEGTIDDADAVILATGSENARLPFEGSEHAIDSTVALSLDRVPGSMMIVGGGVIGVEFASLYSALGTRVTIVEATGEILPAIDRQISAELRKTFRKKNIRVLTSTKLASIKKTGGSLLARTESASGAEETETERVLVCVGRRPRIDGLDLASAGVTVTQGKIAVDGEFRTSAPGVYAIGDCNGLCMLAHAASAQGAYVAERLLGHDAAYNTDVIPSCVYTNPEIAAVGMTEEQARLSGIRYRTGVFNLSGNGKSLIEGGSGGIVKIIADEELGEILGAHMIGPRVTDMIAEVALCMNMQGTVDDIAHTVHAHPTVSESLAEAASAVFGKSIHTL
jgi:dihydrolipoamide dehydrogenase